MEPGKFTPDSPERIKAQEDGKVTTQAVINGQAVERTYTEAEWQEHSSPSITKPILVDGAVGEPVVGEPVVEKPVVDETLEPPIVQ